MKDITAFLFLYDHTMTMNQAIQSLHHLQSRLERIYILHSGKIPFEKLKEPSVVPICFIHVKDDDIGKRINLIIADVSTPFILFLHQNQYLAKAENVNLPKSKDVLITDEYTPVLARTSLLRKQSLPSSKLLPFPEALLHAWICNVSPLLTCRRSGLIQISKRNKSKQWKEKQQFLQKYHQLKSKIEGPGLSIIMANYNMEKYVEIAIASSLTQIQLPEKIHVIDDGSSDSSLEKIEKWKHCPRIQMYQQKNGGKARAINAVLPHVTTEFVMELDADDWLDPDAIHVIKKHLLRLPDDVSVLYGNLRQWKQKDREVQYQRTVKGRPISAKNFLSYPFPLGPRIYRTSYLKQIGGFPVINFYDGRMYEDVTVLKKLMQISRLHYEDFTVYNVRKHMESITKSVKVDWKEYVQHIN
ncbi:MAG TPA: glycosyltransferase family A protein [Bacillota bacterium]|nr:glycosyltransferase family A protein [Bacillota bacterium]